MRDDEDSASYNFLCRTALLPIISVANGVIFLLAAFAGLRLLLVVMLLEGLCLGFHWALLPAYTSDLFGSKAFASNFSMMHLTATLGSVVLNSGLVAPLFERVAKNHGEPPGLCTGFDCFR